MLEALVRHPLAAAIGWGILQSMWQLAAVGLACAIALRLARTAKPDVRYAVCGAGLALMLAWPAATVAGRIRAGEVAGTVVASRPAAAPPAPSAWAEGVSALPAVSSEGGSHGIDLRALLPYAALGWAAGVLLLALRTAGGWMVAERLRRRHSARPPHEWNERLARLARQLNVRAPVALFESLAVDVPTVVGWLKPAVLVPAGAFAGMPARQLEAILAHELAHVRRQDYVANLLQALVETLLFYHPAVWWLSRQARTEREHCCDDLAVAICGDRVEYARALTALEAARRSGFSLALGAAGGPLFDRVARLISARTAHDSRAPIWIAAAVALATAAALLLPPAGAPVEALAVDSLSTLIETGGGTSGTVDQTPPARPVPPAPPAPPAPAKTPPSPTSPAPPSPPAPPPGTSRVLVSHDDGEGVFSYSSTSEKLKVRFKGRIALSEDEHDIAGLDPGGYLIVSEGGWFTSRAVELRAGSSRSIARKYSVGWREQPYEPDGRAFLAEVLPRLLDMGFAARARVEALLARGGPAAVLDATNRLDGDYVRRMYYTHLFTLADLDAPTAARALTQAGTQISSDFERAEVLAAAAPHAFEDAAPRRAYVQMAAGIESDFEARRALDAALDRAAPDPAAVSELVAATRAIASDYEAAEFLMKVARRGPLAPEVRTPFFGALETVDSDFEHRRVLAAVIDRSGQAEETARLTLRSAAHIESSFERAEVLLLWLRSFPFDPMAAAFLEQAAGVASAFDRARVLSSVVERPKLEPAALAAALTAAAGLDSDFELSRVLQEAARRHAITGEVRQAYLAAAGRMRDGFEKDLAYAALVKAETGRIQ